MRDALRVEPVDQALHLRHHFGADAIARQKQQFMGRHRRFLSGSSWPGLPRPSTSCVPTEKKTWMPGTRRGMTKTICVRAGLLERRCTNGKTPLSPGACAIPRNPARLVDPAGEPRESRRAFLATRASRAADPHSVAGTDGWSRYRPLRLFAG